MNRFATKIALVVTVMFAFAGLALVPAASATTTTTTASTSTLVALQNIVRPSIYGKAVVGNKLTARAGEWSPGATDYDFKWYYGNGTAIQGANGMYYTVKPADVGRKIKLRVVAKLAGYANGVAYSFSVLVRQ